MDTEQEPSPPPEPHRSSAAEAVWLQFVAGELDGERVDFEQLCAEHSELAGDLRDLHADWIRAETSPTAPRRKSEPIDDLLSRLALPVQRATRYEIVGEIARGGMGVVRRVWDADLGRHLAMKTLRVAPGADSRHALVRFVEEARIAAELDHPAIVPVHDVGVDELGRPFFVMKLVEGRDLRHVFEQAWNSEEGWSTTRVLGVMLRVCEAAGYAHKKGVIHRDLKPSNVMVGRFGEVYVMDWGVARVLRSSANHDASASPLTSVRTTADGDDSEPGPRTLEGDVVGTAAYMSPEQARGEIERLTPQSDVYAVGAMLYHLFARRAPHASDGSSSAEVLERVRIGPPPPLASLAANLAPELVAICDKAMARGPTQRYADLSELAADLRAYLEGRVVRAHSTRAWTAASKWVRRNRALSANLVALLVILSVLAWQAHRSSLVRANFDEVARLRQPTELLADFDALWPATPGNLPAMEVWLASAEDIAAHIDDYRTQLARLRERALPWNEMSPAETRARRDLDALVERTRRLIDYLHVQRDELRRTGEPSNWEGQTLAEVEAQLELDSPKVAQREALRVERQTWSFASPSEQLMHDRLGALIADLERLVHVDRGHARIERVRRGIALAREIKRNDSVDSAVVWEAAQAAIGDRNLCPLYDGLVLQPQVDLIPLGPDPLTGLWEFAHMPSGAPARRGASGALEITPETCIVLVLLPGGRFEHGAQALDPTQPNFDPYGEPFESPVVRVLLDPFFIAKFEMTGTQWARWVGFDPSSFLANSYVCEHGDVRLRPLENVTWWDCERTLRELGLCLPTEAQWEYAARAQSQLPWSTTGEIGELHEFANVLDPCFDEGQNYIVKQADPELLPDGFLASAPIGSFAPNDFGLHDTVGNVAEWCADIGALENSTPRYLGTGARAANFDHGARVHRGGHSMDGPMAGRVASRAVVGPDSATAKIGVRPARALDP